MGRSWKWLLGVVAAVAALAGGYLLYAHTVANPGVVDEVRADPDGARAAIVALLTLPDGRLIPVNHLREGDTVFLGADGAWWRAFRDGGARVTLEIRGETFEGRAVAKLDDSAYTREVFARLRPNVPRWLPDWLDAKLVVVTLDPP